MKEIPWKNVNGGECHYTGEVDQDGAPCGSGFAIPVINPNFKYEMTCLNGKEHGICKSPYTIVIAFDISF